MSESDTDKEALLSFTAARAIRYLDGVPGRSVAPTEQALNALTRFDELPDTPAEAQETIRLLDDFGSRRALGAEVTATPEQFPALYATFPDATFVVTHRDPVSVTASMATMMAYTTRMAQDKPDVEAIARYWADRFDVTVE
jgi:hypothetical protein